MHYKYCSILEKKKKKTYELFWYLVKNQHIFLSDT